MHTANLMVLIAALLPYLTVGLAKGSTKYDNAAPRAWGSTLQGWRSRAFAAHQNAFEAFPSFAAAVILAELTHADPTRITQLAVAFIVFRVIYVGIYLANIAPLRSLVWALGLGCTIWLFALSL